MTRLTRAQQLTRIELTTAQIRRLSPRRAVRARFLGSRDFAATYDAELLRGATDRDIAVADCELMLLGLLTKSDNLRSILFSGSAAQVVGFYDYHAKVLCARGTGNVLFGTQRYVIAHEYTHALQDQHYSLLKLLPDQGPLAYRNSDSVVAYHALIEGDAVNLGDLYFGRTYNAANLVALDKLAIQPAKGPVIPASIERKFLFPYTGGVGFVHDLYRRGGMNAIDAAYRRLPGSTYEIMYPSPYLVHWTPIPVTLHHVRGFDAWHQTDDDVWGAFGVDLMLWQFLGKPTADSVTVGYRGDRYVFLQHGTDNAILFESVWRDPVAARTAQHGFTNAFIRRFGHVTTRSRVLTGEDVSMYVDRGGSRLTMSYASTTELARQLGTGTPS